MDIMYQPEFILKLKNKVITSVSILNKFKEISKNMPKSTIKVKKNNTEVNNTWYRKKFINNEEKTKKKINGYLNKFTDKNYKYITQNILRLKIDNYDLLKYLSDIFFEKSITENYYIENWTFLLKKIIFSNKKWNFKNKTFLIFTYENLENYYNNLFKNNVDKLLKNNIKEYYKEKKKNLGFILLLVKFYKLKLINDKIIDNCVNSLVKNINNSYKLELGFNLIINLYKYCDIKKKNRYNNLINKYLNDKYINKKSKFILLNFVEKIKEDNLIQKTNNKKKEVNLKVNTILDEYLENKNLDDIVFYLKDISDKLINKKLTYEIFRYIINLENSKKETIINLLLKIIKRNILSKRFIKENLLDLFYDYEELKLDYPNIDNSIKFLINKLLSNKYIDKTNLNILLNKTNIKLIIN